MTGADPAGRCRLPSYVPGRPRRPTRVCRFKLSSNENPYPPLPGVLAATELAVAQMNRYPDLANTAMTAAVAGRLGVAADQLAFGTGSVAVLYHLLQAVCEPGDEVIFAWRSFEAYPIAVQLTGATPVPVPLGPGAVHDLEAMRSAVTPATRAVLLCSPNNPTGPALLHDEVVEFVDSVPDDILIMLDEAYVEFVTEPGAVRGLELLQDRPNVVVLRTFSKAYGLAGFRVGYCVAGAGAGRGRARGRHCRSGSRSRPRPRCVASLAAEEELMARVAELVQRPGRAGRGPARARLRGARTRRGTSSGCRPGRRPLAYAEAFAAAGVMVRPYASGDARTASGSPSANPRRTSASCRSPPR